MVPNRKKSSISTTIQHSQHSSFCWLLATAVLISGPTNFIHSDNNRNQIGADAKETGGRRWIGSEVPNPTLQYPECGNTHQSRICDPDSLLSMNDRLKLSMLIGEAEEMTTSQRRGGLSRCQRVGIQIFILIINDYAPLPPPQIESRRKMLKFAESVSNSWSLPQYCLKYILITLAARPSAMQILAGRRTFIQGADIAQMLTRAKPAFRERDFTGIFDNIISESVKLYDDRRLQAGPPNINNKNDFVAAGDNNYLLTTNVEERQENLQPIVIIRESNGNARQPASGEFPWWGFLLIVLFIAICMFCIFFCWFYPPLRNRFCPCIEKEEDIPGLPVINLGGYTDSTWAGYTVRSHNPSIINSIQSGGGAGGGDRRTPNSFIHPGLGGGGGVMMDDDSNSKGSPDSSTIIVSKKPTSGDSLLVLPAQI